MLHKLLRPRAAVTPRTIPSGQRIYAIGDVHGCLDLLDRLIERIDADDAAREPAMTTLVFLGDLVDRGPDSAGVIERVLHLAQERADVRLLLGNHEEVFLAALGGDAKALRLFCRVGGRETAISYGIAPERYDAMDYDQLHAALIGAVPAVHRAMLTAATDMEVVGDYAFVHAGIHPGRPLAEQRTADLRWIRAPFLDHGKPLEKLIVHGHTIAPDVEYRPHRIGIDTGAYESGTLTALGLEGDWSWVVDTAD